MQPHTPANTTTATTTHLNAVSTHSYNVRPTHNHVGPDGAQQTPTTASTFAQMSTQQHTTHCTSSSHPANQPTLMPPTQTAVQQEHRFSAVSSPAHCPPTTTHGPSHTSHHTTTVQPAGPNAPNEHLPAVQQMPHNFAVKHAVDIMPVFDPHSVAVKTRSAKAFIDRVRTLHRAHYWLDESPHVRSDRRRVAARLPDVHNASRAFRTVKGAMVRQPGRLVVRRGRAVRPPIPF